MNVREVTNTRLTFSNFCLASLMTFISSSFLVFENDLEYDEFLLSVLCFALMLRRPKNITEYRMKSNYFDVNEDCSLLSPLSDKTPGPSRAACRKLDELC